MARASTETLIPLDTWADVVGINPLHFNGAVGGDIFPTNSCDVVWAQYPWQSRDQYMCREDIARLLARSETDVYQVSGQWPRRRQITQTYTVPPNRIITLHGGAEVQRLGTIVPQTLALAASVDYSDDDDDGFNEIATVAVAITDVDLDRVKVYFAGHVGEPTYEIRPVKEIAATATTLTIKFDSWLLLDYRLWDQKPSTANGGGIAPIDATDLLSYVDTVDVTQDIVTDDVVQVITSAYGVSNQVIAGTAEYYNRSSGQIYVALEGRCLIPRVGDTAVVSYEIGLSEPDPALDLLICEMVLARMPDAPCSCNYLQRKYEAVRRDAAFSEGRTITLLQQALVSSPFGSRIGEIQAWQKIHNLGYLNVYMGGAL